MSRRRGTSNTAPLALDRRCQALRFRHAGAHVRNPVQEVLKPVQNEAGGIWMSLTSPTPLALWGRFSPGRKIDWATDPSCAPAIDGRQGGVSAERLLVRSPVRLGVESESLQSGLLHRPEMRPGSSGRGVIIEIDAPTSSFETVQVSVEDRRAEAIADDGRSIVCNGCLDVSERAAARRDQGSDGLSHREMVGDTRAVAICHLKVIADVPTRARLVLERADSRSGP